MAEVVAKAKPVERSVRKFIGRVAVALPDYEAGVREPRADPVARAIAMRGTLEGKMRLKEIWDKWQAKLAGVGFTGWQSMTLQKGLDRYVSGAQAGAPIWEQFYATFKSHLEKGLVDVLRMPRITLEDAIRRAAAMIRHNAIYKFTPKGIPLEELRRRIEALRT